MSTDRTLTAAEAHRAVDYDPATGVMKWRRSAGHVSAGSLAGTVTSYGYRAVTINGHRLQVHRLAWFLFYGIWPTAMIDHINGVKDDNRIYNLREASNAENVQNSLRPRNEFRGVTFVPMSRTPGRWKARIWVGGVVHNLGYFDTAEDAHTAYLAAKQSIHPFWARETV